MRAIFNSASGKLTVARQLRRSADKARDAKDYQLAARLYQQYLVEDPDNGALHVQCGHMHKEIGVLSEAGKHYELAAKLLPDDAELQVQLGHFYNVSDLPDKAIDAYRKALSMDPSLDDARHHLNEALRLKANPDRTRASPGMMLLSRARLQSDPGDFLRNVPAVDFSAAVERISNAKAYFLLDGIEQRFPDHQLDDAAVIATLRLCAEATAFGLASRIVTTIAAIRTDFVVPLDLLKAIMDGLMVARDGQLASIPLHAQLAMLGAATNVIARQRTIISQVVA